MRVSVASVAARMLAELSDRGVDAKDCRIVSDALIASSRRGIHSHGVNLFRHYIRALDEGRCCAKPSITSVQTAASIVRMDCGGGLGIIGATHATNMATLLAQREGIGVVSAANSNHFGAASVYSRAMASEGLLGLVFSNADALVVPHGGRRPMFGTNPISLAARGTGAETFCADFATSQGSFIKALAAFATGEGVKPGYYVDSEGRDLAESGGDWGYLLPLGGHKGQCLGMIVTIISAVLAGGPFDHEMPNLVHPDGGRAARTSHFFLALDPERFGGREGFAARLSQLMAEVRGSARAGDAAVVSPGDLESLAEQRSGPEDVLVLPEDAQYLGCAGAR